MNLLLLSNSCNPGEKYLEFAIPEIKRFLGTSIQSVVFIPYAGVSISWTIYAQKVASIFEDNGYQLVSIHQETKPLEAIKNAQAIVVGGGNTWQLLHLLYENDLVEAIRGKVKNGTPYIGWSAGSNMACPSLKTTNDMPIVAPKSFEALNLIPFQINPHFIDIMPVGHAGETREDRIMEFITVNQTMSVLGLREGTLLKFVDNECFLIGPHTAKIFKFGYEPLLVEPGRLNDFPNLFIQNPSTL